MSEPTEVDVVVVGLGPGGETVASQLAGGGLEVVAVDSTWSAGSAPTTAASRAR